MTTVSQFMHYLAPAGAAPPLAAPVLSATAGASFDWTWGETDPDHWRLEVESTPGNFISEATITPGANRYLPGYPNEPGSNYRLVGEDALNEPVTGYSNVVQARPILTANPGTIDWEWDAADPNQWRVVAVNIGETLRPGADRSYAVGAGDDYYIIGVDAEDDPVTPQSNTVTGLPPAMPAGLLLDYDAAEITGLADTDPLTTWSDSSGNNRFASASGASAVAPIYRTDQIDGLPAVSFGGVTPKHGLWMGPTVGAPDVWNGDETGAELFVVLKLNVDPPTVSLQWGNWHFGTAWNDKTYFPNPDGNIYETFCSTAIHTISDPAPLTNWRLYNTASKDGEWTARLDGTQIFTTASNTFSTATNQGSGNPQNRSLGFAVNSTNAVYMSGLIARVLLFDHVLSAGDRATVHQIIANKYPSLTIA